MKKMQKESLNHRTVKVTPNFCKSADGSVLLEMGNTRVICAASISENPPEHADNKGLGWVTAEYTMLPYWTSPRKKREFTKRDGRSVEIQRLIGRSLRGVLELSKLKGYAISIDCDVLQADGGTRTASITGGFIALKMAIEKLQSEGKLEFNPIISNVAAISAGYVNGELVLDLDYILDSQADVDMNVVMDGFGNFIEIQGTGEGTTYTMDQLNSMLAVASQGIKSLIDIQNKY